MSEPDPNPPGAGLDRSPHRFLRSQSRPRLHRREPRKSHRADDPGGPEYDAEGPRLLLDQAERKRQGFLHAGSTWKGVRSERSENCPSTLLIATREKDEIMGTLTYAYERQQHTASLEGTVQGNIVTLKRTALLENSGRTMGQTYDARLDPTSAAHGGTYALTGTINGTFGYRYEGWIPEKG